MKLRIIPTRNGGERLVAEHEGIFRDPKGLALDRSSTRRVQLEFKLGRTKHTAHLPPEAEKHFNVQFAWSYNVDKATYEVVIRYVGKEPFFRHVCEWVWVSADEFAEDWPETRKKASEMIAQGPPADFIASREQYEAAKRKAIAEQALESRRAAEQRKELVRKRKAQLEKRASMSDAEILEALKRQKRTKDRHPTWRALRRWLSYGESAAAWFKEAERSCPDWVSDI